MRDIFSSPMHLQFDFLDLSSSSLLLNDDKTSAGNDISLFFKGVRDEKEKKRAKERKRARRRDHFKNRREKDYVIPVSKTN